MTNNIVHIERDLLEAALEKLKIYRSQHSGEYTGGWEYSRLETALENALKQPTSTRTAPHEPYPTA